MTKDQKKREEPQKQIIGGIIVIVVAILLFRWCGGCGESETPSNQSTSSSKTVTRQIPFAEEGINTYSSNSEILIPKTTYKIIEGGDYAGIKYTYEIRLSNNKLSKKELEGLAKKLKKKLDKDYERIFISYYLPGKKVGSGAWATSHFDPELKVRILGRTEQEETAPNGDCKAKFFKIEEVIGLISEDIEMIEDYYKSNSEEDFNELIDGLIDVVEQTNLQSKNDINWAVSCCPKIKEPLIDAMRDLELFVKAYKNYNSKKSKIKGYKEAITKRVEKAKSELRKCK